MAKILNKIVLEVNSRSNWRAGKTDYSNIPFGGNMNRIHIFLKKKGGIIYAHSAECPVEYKGTKRNEISYMGYTTDAGWPKKMSTGRILYQTLEKNDRKRIKKAALKSKN